MAKQNAETIKNENRAPAQLGMCCGTPLVATFVFSGAEYYCVRCGSTYGMFDVPRKIETPALREERERNSAAFDSVAKGALHFSQSWWRLFRAIAPFATESNAALLRSLSSRSAGVSILRGTSNIP